MNIKQIITHFGTLVDKRLETHGHEFSTEDNIRYDFFYALTSNNEINPWDIILEAPYPLEILNLDSNGSEIDLLVKPTEKISNGLICEFKYDRKANSTVNKTNRYGKLVNDLLRLCLLKHNSSNYNSLFVYVSDIEMMKYKKGFYFDQQIDTEFELTNEVINNLPLSAIKQLNPIFLNPFVTNSLKAICNLIHKQTINQQNKKYGIYVWTISSSQH